MRNVSPSVYALQIVINSAGIFHLLELLRNMEPIQNTLAGSALRVDGCHHRPAILCPIGQRCHLCVLRQALLFGRVDRIRFDRV
jgi:hypothetical protein